jgi:hypothetical protein
VLNCVAGLRLSRHGVDKVYARKVIVEVQDPVVAFVGLVRLNEVKVNTAKDNSGMLSRTVGDDLFCISESTSLTRSKTRSSDFDSFSGSMELGKCLSMKVTQAAMPNVCRSYSKAAWCSRQYMKSRRRRSRSDTSVLHHVLPMHLENLAKYFLIQHELLSASIPISAYFFKTGV